MSDVNNNTLVGFDAGNLTLSGSQNSSLGSLSLNSLTSGSFNSAFGYSALRQVTTGANNTAVGDNSGLLISTASGNTSVGSGSLSSHTTGLGHNTAIGFDALSNVTTGQDNTALGYQAGQNYTGAETNNIVIGNTGTLADAGIIRIGTGGTHIENFQAGISGVTPPGVLNMVVVDTGTGQLGSATIPTGTLTQLSGNTGVAIAVGGNINVVTANATPTFVGAGATLTQDFGLSNLALGSSMPSLALAVENAGLGSGALNAIANGSRNVAVGYQALLSTVNGASNVAIGNDALRLLGSDGNGGSANTAVGSFCLRQVVGLGTHTALGYQTGYALTGGTNNVFLGHSAAASVIVCTSNIIIGDAAGAAYTGNNVENSNIIIGNTGTAAESNTIRIGTSGAGSGQQNKCFIAGIDGVVVANQLMVVLNSVTEQLGTAAIPSGTISLTGDTGGALVSAAFTIFANQAANNAGATVTFSGSGSTLTFNVTDASNNNFIGKTVGNTTLTGTNNIGFGNATSMTGLTTGTSNIGIGSSALQNIVDGAKNIGIGFGAGLSITGGQFNTCIGDSAGGAITNSGANVAIGYTSMAAGDTSNNTFVGFGAGFSSGVGGSNTGVGYQVLGSSPGGSNVAMGVNCMFMNSGGNNNTAIGYQAIQSITSGSNNIALGYNAGVNLITGTEANNILIGNSGVNADSAKIRIGTNGTQTSCFIVGIDTVNVGSVAKVVTMASDQLGTATITAGAGITVTPGANTITIAATSTGLTWTVITVNQTIAVNNGYICNKAGTLALLLPATAAIGDVFRVTGINTATGIQITQNANQQIFFGAASTTVGVGGSMTSTAIRDSLELVCVVAGASTVWNCVSAVGNWTIV